MTIETKDYDDVAQPFQKITCPRDLEPFDRKLIAVRFEVPPPTFTSTALEGLTIPTDSAVFRINGVFQGDIEYSQIIAFNPHTPNFGITRLSNDIARTSGMEARLLTKAEAAFFSSTMKEGQPQTTVLSGFFTDENPESF